MLGPWAAILGQIPVLLAAACGMAQDVPPVGGTGDANRPAAAAEADGEQTAAPAASGTPGARTIDFRRDIQPILVERCVHCHGPDDQREGLRLDTRAFALRGGFSGRTIVGGTLETNELYRRVSSTDQTFRMPKREDALSEAEVDRIRRWVLEGCDWPADGMPPATAPGAVAKPEVSRWGPIAWSMWIEPKLRAVDSVPCRQPISVGWLLLGLLTLVVMRAHKQARRRGTETWITRTVTPARVAGVWLVGFVIAAGIVERGYRERALETARGAVRNHLSRLKELESQLAISLGSAIERFGDPPIPPRMTHPKAVSRTYYRGNCERNPTLFNGGNYCTAFFHLRYCSRDGRPLDVGDRVPEDGLAIRFEIERAPGSTESLFAGDVISSVFLSPDYYGRPTRRNPDRMFCLREERPTCLWSVVVPIDSVPDPRLRMVASAESNVLHPQAAGREPASSVSAVPTAAIPAASPVVRQHQAMLAEVRPDGALYVGRLPIRRGDNESKPVAPVVSSPPAGPEEEGLVTADISYVVCYSLGLADGCLSGESDVWFGCLWQPPVVQAQSMGNRIAFAEWLDWRPLPIITGTNTSDPKLLGILDHRPDYQPTAPAEPVPSGR